MKQKLINGDEFEAVYSRSYIGWGRKELRRIKRGMNKRQRKEAKQEIHHALEERIQQEGHLGEHS